MNAAEPEEPVVRCEECRRVLHDPLSKARKVGPICVLKRSGSWLLAWHHRPPRLGYLPHGGEPIDGQDVLFPVQTMIPTRPARGEGEQR